MGYGRYKTPSVFCIGILKETRSSSVNKSKLQFHSWYKYKIKKRQATYLRNERCIFTRRYLTLITCVIWWFYNGQESYSWNRFCYTILLPDWSSEITMDIRLSLNHTSFISVVACNLLSFRTVEHNLCMYINQQDTQNSVMRLYFPLDALHVSDYISPSSGATL